MINEYAVKHDEEANIDNHNTFETIHEAVEWARKREEPTEWRIYERTITEWKEVQ